MRGLNLAVITLVVGLIVELLIISLFPEYQISVDFENIASAIITEVVGPVSIILYLLIAGIGFAFFNPLESQLHTKVRQLGFTYLFIFLGGFLTLVMELLLEIRLSGDDAISEWSLLWLYDATLTLGLPILLVFFLIQLWIFYSTDPVNDQVRRFRNAGFIYCIGFVLLLVASLLFTSIVGLFSDISINRALTWDNFMINGILSLLTLNVFWQLRKALR